MKLWPLRSSRTAKVRPLLSPLQMFEISAIMKQTALKTHELVPLTSFIYHNNLNKSSILDVMS